MKYKSNSDNYIFVKHITRNGVTYYASDYGKKAFRIKIKN